MVAFYLGLILGALGSFMFLVLLSMVVRKDKGMELPDGPSFERLPPNRVK